MSENALWYEKYRPETLDDYVWTSEEIRGRIKYWLTDPSSMPHVIFEGPPGTGKTTLARLLINGLDLETYDYLFINTNKFSGVDAIRETVTNFCEGGGFSGLKLVVIDEADGLSIAAQDKLRGVINDYGAFVRFVFTCNKIRALSDALKSRARTFTLKRLDRDEFMIRLHDIAVAESVIDPGAESDLDTISKITERTYPDLRRGIDLLQDCSSKDGLRAPKGLGEVHTEWQASVIDIVTSMSNATTIRETVVSMRRDEIEECYRFLYEKSGELFTDPDKEQAAVVLIADYLRAHSVVSFPEINLAGLLNKLVKLQRMDT